MSSSLLMYCAVVNKATDLGSADRRSSGKVMSAFLRTGMCSRRRTIVFLVSALRFLSVYLTNKLINSSREVRCMGELERTLSFPVMLIIGINSLMGTGVFFLAAVAAGVAGTSSLISWVVMALIAVGISMVFAELASMIDTAGGVYDYAKQVFGNFTSFMVGWLMVVVGNVTIAMFVVGAIQYLNPSLPIVYTIALSIMLILLFNFMTYKGMEASSVMLVSFGVITMTTIISLLVPGLIRFSTTNLTPLFSHSTIPVIIGVVLVADTYFGWQTITFLSEETKDARKVIPKVLVYSTVFAGVMTVLFAVSVLATIHWQVLSQSSTPLRLISEVLYGAGMDQVFAILIYMSILGSVAGWIVSSPRLLMALAKDKMFIPQLARIHPKNKTPHVAIAFQTVLTSALVLVAAGNYEQLLALSLPLAFLLYAIVIVTMIFMRSKLPDHKRYYTVPGGRFTAYVLLLAIVLLMGVWALHDPLALGVFALGASLLLLGWPVYLLLKYTYDPEAVSSHAHVHGRLMVWFEDLLLPRSLRKHIIGLLRLPNKRVLEFGGNAGTFTMHLADEVGPQGLVISTELSASNVEIIRRRAKKLGHSHVQVIHDEHHLNRIHPSVEHVDMFVSIGYLSYIQDLRKILGELRELIPEKGVILLVEYVDYFWFLPNTGWTSDLSRLQALFAQEGFVVTVSKKRGFLWNYLIIHGIRSDEDVPFI